jgi:hypothetical protein
MNFVITTPSTTQTSNNNSGGKVNARLVSPGEVICDAEGFLRGHGNPISFFCELISQGLF